MHNKIQRVEITTNYNTSIHCPFCGQKAFDVEAGEAGQESVNPCPHTLFVAHDEGFEFRSDLFNAQLNLPEGNDDLDLAEQSIDELTDQAAFDDGIKFAAYVGAPSSFGSYIGFTSTPRKG